MIEQGIESLLRADTALAALLASGIITPVVLDQNAPRPGLTYMVKASKTTYTLFGNALTKKMIQFDAYSRLNGVGSYSEVKTIIQSVHRILDGYHGTLSGGTVVLSCLRAGETDYFESASRGFQASTDFEVTYQG